jgi:predicted helicase
MSGISIALLVKNSNANRRGQIYYHDIGDDLTCKVKLEAISNFTSIAGIAKIKEWKTITPDQHGDWLKQRNSSFSEFVVLGSKKQTTEIILFEVFSNGVISSRDAWVYSFSKQKLTSQCQNMVSFYNDEIHRYDSYIKKGGTEVDVQNFVQKDLTRISWGGGNWQTNFKKLKQERFENEAIRVSLFRPFTKTWHYGGKNFNHSFYSMHSILPNEASVNLVISVSGIGARSGFSALITNMLPNYHALDTGLFFPLYIYDKSDCSIKGSKKGNANLFAESTKIESKRRDAITDEGLAHFQAAYPNESLSKEDLFYYIYGLLHSPDYRERYADNLTKELPRIPCVKTAADFWAFSKAGRKLADWHVNYETVEPYPVTLEITGKTLTAADYRVEKMRYGKNGKDKDLTTLHYNAKITLRGIPLEAYDYVVNGKPALDWVVERQCVKTDKDSGIVNDANDWATETMHNPRYPLELFMRVITVSLETLKIVKNLPALDLPG